MADIPSGALAGAAVSAVALADILTGLIGTLPVRQEIAYRLAASARYIGRVQAPRMAGQSDAAAIALALAQNVQTLARAASAAECAAALYGAAVATQSAFPRSASPVLTRLYGLGRAMAVGFEVQCLGEAFLAEARTAFADRPAADRARGRIAAARDDAAGRIASLLGEATFVCLADVAGQTSVYIAQQLASLRPVVRVQSGRSYPSTALAWGLYADPAQADELVLRNNCSTPLFMPADIEALSPQARLGAA